MKVERSVCVFVWWQFVWWFIREKIVSLISQTGHTVWV